MSLLFFLLWTYLVYKVGLNNGWKKAYNNVKVHIDRTGILFINEETWKVTKQ